MKKSGNVLIEIRLNFRWSQIWNAQQLRNRYFPTWGKLFLPKGAARTEYEQDNLNYQKRNIQQVFQVKN